MFKLTRRSSMGIAAVAACILLLNAFASAWSSAAAAASPNLDAFGNVLCLPDQGGQNGGHGTLPNCCTFGCTMGSSVLEPPDRVAGVVERPRDNLLIVWRSHDEAWQPEPDIRPGDPRAPPASA
ncbi:MAG: hypothetical protein M9924_09570 [Rhizobiaceae bacterium]|nr:hypothetical protein [Rhizobiaceae bacterium]